MFEGLQVLEYNLVVATAVSLMKLDQEENAKLFDRNRYNRVCV